MEEPFNFGGAEKQSKICEKVNIVPNRSPSLSRIIFSFRILSRATINGFATVF
jgi:hypothetical protein